eukprot:6264837-Amphidinium_carterae.4
MKVDQRSVGPSGTVIPRARCALCVNDTCFEAFRVAQKCKIGAFGFLQQNGDVWPLVLPRAETSQLMELKEGDSLYDVQDTLQKLIQTPVGSKLFGWLWKTVARHAMKKHVSEELSRLAELEKLSESDVNES